MLRRRVRLVNDSNASCLSIACNTAHVLLPELQKVSKTPFVSMIDETAERVYKDGINNIGLLGTPSTIRYGLYQAALNKNGISSITPSKVQIKMLEKIIRNAIKGKTTKKDTKSLTKIADDLRIKGAKGIVLGCTELPLVYPKKYSLPVYNCVEILAMAVLKKYYKPYV